MVTVVIVIKKIETTNRDFYKETATIVKKERCDELMFGTSWEVRWKIIEVKWNSYVNILILTENFRYGMRK